MPSILDPSGCEDALDTSDQKGRFGRSPGSIHQKKLVFGPTATIETTPPLPGACGRGGVGGVLAGWSGGLAGLAGWRLGWWPGGWWAGGMWRVGWWHGGM